MWIMLPSMPSTAVFAVLTTFYYKLFGCMIALVNKITHGKAITKKEFGCAACPGCGKAGSCSGKEASAE